MAIENDNIENESDDVKLAEENANEENSNDEDSNDDQNEDQNEDFDPTSFTDIDEPLGGGIEEVKKGQEDSEEKVDDDDDNDESDDDEKDVWDPFENDDEEEEEDESDPKNEDDDEEEEEEEEDDDDSDNKIDENEAGAIVSKFNSLGLRGEKLEDIYAEVQGVLQEKKAYENASFVNDNIKAWRKYLSLSDEELVLANYKAENVPEEERTKLLDNLKENNILANEAIKIRSAIRGSIDKEVQTIKKQNQEQDAKQKRKVEQVRADLKNHLDKTETMFGFKMAKEGDLESTRQKLYDYISTGKFANEIFATPESVSQMAWMFKNKERIIKALENKGIQTGKKEVLDSMENPSKDTRQPHNDSDYDKGGFDPVAFTDTDEI